MEVEELYEELARFQGYMVIVMDAGEEELHKAYVKITRFLSQQIKEKTVCSQQTALKNQCSIYPITF